MMSRRELERIYETHGPSAYALFCQFTRNETDARDLLQDWLVKIGRGLDRLPKVDNERAYLLKIAHRQALDWNRRKKTRHKYHQAFRDECRAPFAPEPDPDRDTIRRALEEAVAGLPPEQRLVVELKLWEELTFPQIADMLGISVNTAGSRYRYGLDKLREQLRPCFNEIVPS